MRINTQFFARLMLLAFLSVMILMFAGCRSKKVSVDKKEETVSVLQVNDIKKSEASEVETSTITLTENQNWSVSPVDSQKTSKVVYKGDTLSFLNAKVDFNKTQTSEDKNSKSNQVKSEEDNSTTKSESGKSEKKRNSESKSLSWGLNLAIIVGVLLLLFLGFVHFKTRKANPFE